MCCLVLRIIKDNIFSYFYSNAYGRVGSVVFLLSANVFISKIILKTMMLLNTVGLREPWSACVIRNLFGGPRASAERMVFA